CIDQSDDKERGHQWRPMSDVYQHASSVVVWLGLDEGNSRKAMDFPNEIGAFAYDPHWDGLRQILKRSYSSRLWVIQELVVTD
ncbi:uncharacterized protein K444DRAFT_513477, partial [Hyaloscypha bicolor E]